MQTLGLRAAQPSAVGVVTLTVTLTVAAMLAQMLAAAEMLIHGFRPPGGMSRIVRKPICTLEAIVCINRQG